MSLTTCCTPTFSLTTIIAKNEPCYWQTSFRLSHHVPSCEIAGIAGLVVRKNLEIRGAYMSSRSTPQTLVQLVESKVLNFDQLEVKGFPLDTITECVKQARMASALQFMVLEPNK